MSSMQSAAASSLRVKRVEEEKRERVDKEEEYGDRQPHKSITDTTKAVMVIMDHEQSLCSRPRP